ncbi:MAG: acylphosphatase, partial [Acidobacteriota bacterium]|nr:acylphosphatase [Acidobacteriota bacterium]
MRERRRIAIYGAVQGVGFRPFVYRLAGEIGLGGSILNSSSGVFVEIEGETRQIEEFLARLPGEKPPASVIVTMESSSLDPRGSDSFEILPSDPDAVKSAYILPDLATCPACLEEILDPGERRHGYAFTNCTHCGPRYTIIHDIPYDRPNTTMRGFPLCEACGREYRDPADRRFHAQPVACPACGPRLEIVDSHGERIDGSPSDVAAALLREGGILALKGIGGYLLLADALQDDSVALLRIRKHREEKPFAVLFPTLEAVHEFCHAGDEEKKLLQSAAAPIVLLRPKRDCRLSPEVSRSSPYVG